MLWRWDELLVVVEVGLRIILPLQLGLKILLLDLRTLGRHAGLRLLLLLDWESILLRVAVLVLRILAIAGLPVAVVEWRHPERHVLSPVSYTSRLAFASGHIHRFPRPPHLHLCLTLDQGHSRAPDALSSATLLQVPVAQAEAEAKTFAGETCPNFHVASHSRPLLPFSPPPQSSTRTMAPAPTTKSNKAPMRGGKSGPSKSVGPSKGGAGSSKIRKGSSSAKKPQGQVSGEQKKSKSANSSRDANKKKKKIYTAKELGIPELNGITPEGVTKPPNMKKGKNFVDDNEGMAAIMAMVMAEKDGNIESKMQKARHLEELREAKKAEAEKRAQSKKETFEGRMENIKNNDNKKKRGGQAASEDAPESRKSMKNGVFKGFGNDAPLDKKPSKKRVSFG